MRRLKENLSRPQHADGNPWDDGPLPDLTSGVMWSATGLLGALVIWLPGSASDHRVLALSLAGVAIAWGLFEIHLAARDRHIALTARALITASTMPIVALALFATGGATSFLQPVMIFTALFISYFFPPKLAWPLMALFVYAFATPLFYDDRVLEVGFPARLAMFGLACAGTTLAIQFLKRRLVQAESRQRAIAELDPLTGVNNRRGFDAALSRIAAAREPYALILIDLDDFKRVNDELGHQAGDAVLQAVASEAAGVARQNDCVARIGGDEFAIIAPGAGPAGVLRLLRDLRKAISHPATLAAALAPEDGRTPAGLFARADARLVAQKRDVRQQRQSALR